MTNITLPSNTAAEEAILSTCLSHPKQFEKVKDVLSKKDFYWGPHGDAWEAMRDTSADGMQVGPITLADRLDMAGILSDFSAFGNRGITGINAISGLVDNHHANVRDIETLAAIIKNLSGKRKIYYTLQRHIEPTLNGKPTPELIRSLTQELSEIESQAIGNGEAEILTTSQALKMAYDGVEAAASGKNPAIPTGLADLDRYLGGWRRGDYVTIAGRPGMGKTSLLLTTALHAIKHGKRVGFFSLEMDAAQVMNRMISQESEIPGELIRDGKMDESQWATYAATVSMLETKTLHVCQAPRLDMGMLRTFSRKMSYLGLDVLCVDYLGLITPSNGKENRVTEVSEITRNLKLLARELQIPILVAAQMSRAIETRAEKEPQLSDLRESGSIEQDSDIVIFVWGKYPEKRSHATLKIGKHRNGPVGSADAFFNVKTTKFCNMTREGSDYTK